MITCAPLVRWILCLLASGLLPAVAMAQERPRILYLYGDVAADGTVPSGPAEPFHQMRLADSGPRGMSQFKAALEAVGFQVGEAYDADLRLDADTLRQIRVLILGSNQKRFSANEAAAVRAWVEAGGGLLAWSDSAFGGHFREAGIDNVAGRLSNNDLTTQFGMFFMTDSGGGNYLVRSYEFDHFINANKRDGGVVFRGEGVSPVRVSEPASMLARMQEGGLGGALRLNAVDGPLDLERDAALAIAEVGRGRVVGVFDRNLFWNAGEGTRLAHSDNLAFTQRIALWAAGLDKDAKRVAAIAGRPGGGKPNLPPAVKVSAQAAEAGGHIDLVAAVRDDDDDGREPDVRWKQVGGPSGAKFENNNSIGQALRVLVSEPGNYEFQAVVTDGEFGSTHRVKVVVPAKGNQPKSGSRN